MISHLIPTMKEAAIWKIGNGETLVSEFCFKLGTRPPDPIKREKISHVLGNEGQRDMLLISIPIRARAMLRDTCFNDSKDVILWNGAQDGVFSTKVCFESFQTKFSKELWASRLWKTWLPAKVSCFIWRFWLNALPTDDNIRKSHVLLTSKCSCCRVSPNTELEKHLFYHGEWARRLWSFMSNIFDIHVVHGNHSFLKAWKNMQNKWPCFGFAMACCGLWELWKARNALRHDDYKGDWWYKWKAWGTRIAILLKGISSSNYRHRLILDFFGISPTPENLPIIRRSEFLSHVGFTINIAYLDMNGRTRGGATIRNNQGAFHKAIVINLGLTNHLNDLSILLNVCRNHCTGPISRVQSSHPCMRALSPPENQVAICTINSRRRCLESWPDVLFEHICAMDNRAATTLVCTSPCGVYARMSQLHRATTRCILADLMEPGVLRPLPSPTLSASQDDIAIPFHGSYELPHFHDDTSV